MAITFVKDDDGNVLWKSRALKEPQWQWRDLPKIHNPLKDPNDPSLGNLFRYLKSEISMEPDDNLKLSDLVEDKWLFELGVFLQDKEYLLKDDLHPLNQFYFFESYKDLKKDPILNLDMFFEDLRKCKKYVDMEQCHSDLFHCMYLYTLILNARGISLAFNNLPESEQNVYNACRVSELLEKLTNIGQNFIDNYARTGNKLFTYNSTFNGSENVYTLADEHRRLNSKNTTESLNNYPYEGCVYRDYNLNMGTSYNANHLYNYYITVRYPELKYHTTYNFLPTDTTIDKNGNEHTHYNIPYFDRKEYCHDPRYIFPNFFSNGFVNKVEVLDTPFLQRIKDRSKTGLDGVYRGCRNRDYFNSTANSKPGEGGLAKRIYSEAFNITNKHLFYDKTNTTLMEQFKHCNISDFGIYDFDTKQRIGYTEYFNRYYDAIDQIYSNAHKQLLTPYREHTAFGVAKYINDCPILFRPYE